MASSALYPNEIVIDDSTSTDVTHGDGTLGRGLELPFGASYEGAADPFPAELLIPESEWQARIKELEDLRQSLSLQMRDAKLPAKDQKSLNFCWVFGPTQAVEVIRLLQRLEYVSLSPASAGAQIKNFRNVGGWGREALEFIAEHGLVPSAKWPDTSLDRSLLTDASKALALDYRVTEWTALAPRNLDQHISMLLHLKPTAVGRSWWSHETLDCDAVWLDGEVAVRTRNQWAGWGDDNFAVIRGSKMYADDAVCPRVTVAK